MTIGEQDGSNVDVNAFIDWCYGKEADATYGKVSRYIRDNVTRRPAAGDANTKWHSFDALRSHRGYYQFVTSAELEAAITAYKGS